MRARICEDMEFLGIKIDPEKNRNALGKEAEIQTPDSKIRVMVIPTDEEIAIARDTFEIASGTAKQALQ
jgi:acetate kinase